MSETTAQTPLRPQREHYELTLAPGSGFNVEAHTLLVDGANSESRSKEIIDVARHMGIGGQVLTVLNFEGASSKELDEWTRIHKERSAIVMDGDAANIRERLEDPDSAMYVFADPRIEGEILRHVELPPKTYKELTPDQKKANNPAQQHGGRSRSGGQAVVANDYQGSLGGGSPRNALRLNTSSPKNTSRRTL